MAAWYWMDYAEQVKTGTHGSDFTFYKYRNLKRKQPKDETKPETKPETDAETNSASASTDATKKAASFDAHGF
jgi:lipopolysaccharide/colanic/teichoic acid biosynthesis glycosyltransferase